MQNMTEMSFKDRTVRAIVCAAFPCAMTRRSVKVSIRASYHVADYWDGGSRDEARFVRLSDLSVQSSDSLPKDARQVAGNPYGLPIADVLLTGGFVVVEHCYFCGKDLGYRIYATGDDMLALTSGNVPALNP